MTASLVDTYAMPSDGLLAAHAGACRYVSHVAGKAVTRAQVGHIHALHRVVVLNFEDAATNAKGGARQGSQDGQFFVSAAHELAAPQGVAGYASVDYEVHAGAALRTALAYLEAWSTRLHAAGYLSGGYGDYDLGVAALKAGVVDLWWQTTAWSYARRMTNAVMYQDVFTQGYDVDELQATFYGAWTPTGAQHHPGDTMPLTTADLAAIRTVVKDEIKTQTAALNTHADYLTGLVIHGDAEHPNAQDKTAPVLREIAAKAGQ